jgi:hypothetical protein
MRTVISKPVKAKTISMPIIAELFPSQPLEWDDFSADPLVRMRKGMLITESMNINQRRRNEYTIGGPWRGASQYDSWYFGCITRK